MRFQGALIKEQGNTFAIVIVKKHILDNTSKAKDAIIAFQPAFPGVPVILMAQDSRGVPSYYGNSNIVNFMSSVPIEAVPWMEYTIG